MNASIIADEKTNFRPTDEAVAYATKFANDFGFDSVLVPVNFPGKQRGIWTEGQTRETVFDAGLIALWIERDNALEALDSGHYGNAMFRVYADGHAHLVDEA